jgi:hypothetical protein
MMLIYVVPETGNFLRFFARNYFLCESPALKLNLYLQIKLNRSVPIGTVTSMSFIHQQISSFLNLGICKEYPTMAKAKSPSGNKLKDESSVNNPVNNPAVQAPVAAKAEQTAPLKTSAVREGAKLAVVKTDSRATVMPINLEDEIRRRAYELSERRGFSSGHENEDWLVAESEVLHRYRQQSASA